MSQVLDQPLPQTPNEADLVAAALRILAASPEPLTPSKIRSHLPTTFRSVSLEQLIEALRRRVDANVLYEYPPYRSQQHRYWDRPPAVHTLALIRASLEEAPLTWSQLRRKLPDYARHQAQEILKDQVDQGLLHQHPRAGSRSGERYGLHAPDPREPLRQEFLRLFDRLQRDYNFTRPQLRAAALELLHEEEWDSTPAPEPAAETPQGPAHPPHAAEESARAVVVLTPPPEHVPPTPEAPQGPPSNVPPEPLP
jgi:hypothetical protein